MKTLPISHPPLVGLLSWAYTLTITSSFGRTEEWFYNNFIQLHCNKDILSGEKEMFLNFYRGGQFEFNSNNPFLYSWNIGMDLLSLLGNISYTEILIDGINQGYYPVMFVNEKYIPHCDAYHRYDLHHHILIFGYDRNKKIFFTSGFSQGVYKNHEVSFEDMEKSIQSIIELIKNNENQSLQSSLRIEDYQSYFFKFNDNYTYTFDMKVVKNQITDYLHARNSENLLNRNVNPTIDSFGLAIYDTLTEYFDKRQSINIIGGPIRQLHILWEHKMLMVKRLEFLSSKGILNCDHLQPYFRDLSDKAMVLRNKCIKNSLKEDVNLHTQIIISLKEIKDMEENYLEILLKNI